MATEGKTVVNAYTEKVKKSVDLVLQTDAGKVLWAHLFHRCGFGVSSLVVKADGEVAPMATECKEAQRLIYIDLRKLADRELLAAAEFLAETPATPAAKSVEEERK